MNGRMRFRILGALVKPGGLILAHNTTNLGETMEDYIEAVTSNPELETRFIHRHNQGIGITLKKRRAKQSASAAPMRGK
jgi:hypothetical protein